ncbi:uncharacterized protein LOC122531443 [Frieseomelitta varia]|uniref:uncharacterized protein LOC122531443 n=1 Tax=Frieseomelitta varia TaxID=561572 RepID=UPI001CB67A67|nr:uncharacterized protein LOC122531443 [Frieseomelitta varia]
MPVELRASAAKLGPSSGTLTSLAGATVRVHASTRGNRAFTPMDRAKRENDTHSKPTLYGNKRLLELDLDYLERRGGETITCENAESGSKEEESPADTLDRVKVVFLGAPRVGKSSIIRQFVWSEFCEEYKPTERRETFYPSVVLADRLYELKITDLPMIPYFPVSSHLEWTDFRYYGLRSANAYVLVFDLSNQDTFQINLPFVYWFCSMIIPGSKRKLPFFYLMFVFFKFKESLHLIIIIFNLQIFMSRHS